MFSLLAAAGYRESTVVKFSTFYRDHRSSWCQELAVSGDQCLAWEEWLSSWLLINYCPRCGGGQVEKKFQQRNQHIYTIWSQRSKMKILNTLPCCHNLSSLPYLNVGWIKVIIFVNVGLNNGIKYFHARSMSEVQKISSRPANLSEWSRQNTGKYANISLAVLVRDVKRGEKKSRNMRAAGVRSEPEEEGR